MDEFQASTERSAMIGLIISGRKPDGIKVFDFWL